MLPLVKESSHNNLSISIRGCSMKMLKIAFIWLTLLTPSFALGAEIAGYDGNGWSGLSSESKHSFIVGFMIASSYIDNSTNFAGWVKDYNESKGFDLHSDAIGGKKKKFTSADVMNILEYQARVSNDVITSYTLHNITNGQIVTGLNQLYSDFRNTQIYLADAIHLVKKRILGASDEEIEALSQYVRGGKTDYSKLFYQEKSGRTKWAKFP